jgi:hypothetical protein
MAARGSQTVVEGLGPGDPKARSSAVVVEVLRTFRADARASQAVVEVLHAYVPPVPFGGGPAAAGSEVVPFAY